MLSSPVIHAILQSYGLDTSDSLCGQIQLYIDLLLKWNRRISLTSVESEEKIVRYHFAESFLATRACESVEGRLADVGTGAGFPGLALKIYRPQLRVSLIESNSKKCAFLAEVIRLLHLDETEVVRSRYGDIKRPRNLFDIVTARALGDVPSLLRWAESALGANGRVLLWLGSYGVEQARASAPPWSWNQPYPIPSAKGRFILVGSPKNPR